MFDWFCFHPSGNAYFPLLPSAENTKGEDDIKKAQYEEVLRRHVTRTKSGHLSLVLGLSSGREPGYEAIANYAGNHIV